MKRSDFLKALCTLPFVGMAFDALTGEEAEPEDATIGDISLRLEPDEDGVWRKKEPSITIRVDGADPYNPRHVNLAKEAAELYHKRYKP